MLNLTEWEKIRQSNLLHKITYETPLVYDGRNIYNVEDMYRAGVEYFL
jgi:UDPglucose 6-dehydrogenase